MGKNKGRYWRIYQGELWVSLGLNVGKESVWGGGGGGVICEQTCKIIL